MHQYKFILRLFNYEDLDIKVISFWATVSSIFCSFANNFLGISAGLFALLFLIMIVDYITGLTASHVEETRSAKADDRPRKDVFSSRKGLGWVFKFGSYITFLYLSFMLHDYIVAQKLDSIEYVSKIAHFYILLHIFYWELKSVDENFERIGYDFKIFGLFTKIFRTIKGILEPNFKSKKNDKQDQTTTRA